MGKITTIEQGRSKYALDCIKEVIKNKSDKKFQEEYKSIVKKLSMMILKNGLLQTAVFLEAKNKEHHKTLIEHLKNYLINFSPLRMKIDTDLFSEYLNSSDVAEYRNITTDILAFSKWLSRYADALIEQEDTGE